MEPHRLTAAFSAAAAAVFAAVPSWAATAEPTSAELRAAAQRVLAQPQYRRFSPEAYDWIRRAIETVKGWVDSFSALRHTSPVTFWLIYGGLLLLLVALVVHITVVVRRALRSPVAAEEEAPASARGSLRLAEAERAAARGDFLAAVRLLFADLLERASGRGWIEAHPYQTPRGLARAAARRLPDAWHATLRLAAARLEHGLYAGLPLGEDDWREVHASYERSRTGRAAPPAASPR